jgi:hypothetical protein
MRSPPRSACPVYLALLPAFVAACATSGSIGRGAYCAPPARAVVTFTPDRQPPPGASREERAAALLGLSQSCRNGERSEAYRVQALERIEIARLAIGASAAELHCEAERARQAAEALSRAQSRDVQALTIASIAASAATAIAGVFLSTHHAIDASQDAIAIGGGALTAGLALGSLAVQPRVRFDHARNLLAAVWVGPEVALDYPPVVWAYLTQSEFSNDGSGSIRQHIAERWRRFEGVGADPVDTRLLFGSGGDYDADALRTRAAMLAEIAVEVELANQELSAFASSALGP